MSAPKNAEPLGTEGWTDGRTKKPVLVTMLPRVGCQCGWHGRVHELLAVDDEETLWCPQCRTSGWVYE